MDAEYLHLRSVSEATRLSFPTAQGFASTLRAASWSQNRHLDALEHT